MRPPHDDGSDPDETTTSVVPMFPLADVVLFPGTVLPLHVFEPRYRQMVEDELDRAGRLVVANVKPDERDDMAGSPDVHSIAGLGEIVRHRRLDGGRFMIWLVGISRVHLEEVESDRDYRKVKINEVAEEGVPDSDALQLRVRLRTAIEERVREGTLPDDPLPLGVLADLLVQCIGLEAGELQDLYEELSIQRRAEQALDLHERRPPKPGDDDDAEEPPEIPDFLPESFDDKLDD